MPDQGTNDSVAGKFQAWASSLSGDEQEALASWMTRGQDVEAYGAGWWQNEQAWAEAWTNSWSW